MTPYKTLCLAPNTCGPRLRQHTAGPAPQRSSAQRGLGGWDEQAGAAMAVGLLALVLVPDTCGEVGSAAVRRMRPERHRMAESKSAQFASRRASSPASATIPRCDPRISCLIPSPLVR